MAIIQWVNLEKDTEYENDSEVGSVDRCGAVAIKNVFAKANVPLIFKLGLSPVGGGNMVCGAAELYLGFGFSCDWKI